MMKHYAVMLLYDVLGASNAANGQVEMKLNCFSGHQLDLSFCQVYQDVLVSGLLVADGLLQTGVESVLYVLRC